MARQSHSPTPFPQAKTPKAACPLAGFCRSVYRMTNEETGMTTLMIPALPSTHGDLVQVRISTAARDHLAAWDATSRLEAIHESGHGCAAASASIAVRVMEITSRAGGHTQVATPLDDTTVPWETSGRILDRIVIALSGSAAERVILGEHTTGGETDNDQAVMLAMRWVKAGFAGPGVFLGEDGLGFSYSRRRSRRGRSSGFRRSWPSVRRVPTR